MTNTTLNVVDFNQFVVTKQSINNTAKHIADLVADGEISPIDAIVKLKAFSDLYDALRPLITDSIIAEIDKGNTSSNGVEVSTMETAIKYDYTTTKKWVELHYEIEKLTQELKVLETTIKTLTRPMQILDESTGELIEIKPAKKSSKTSFKVSYK
jgi:hypothetical protein